MLGVLVRKYSPVQTTGHFSLYDGDVHIFSCKTIELPWKDNAKEISCIPEGTYDVVAHVSPKFGNCLKVLKVPKRSDILIHPANFFFQLKGCIAVGKKFIDLNNDGAKDITDSKITANELYRIAPNGFKLKIVTDENNHN